VDKFNVKRSAENARRTHKRLTIVAGSLARRKILSPSGLDTRPMMGMVRGATFDMIMSLIGSRSNTAFPPGSRWLDLFAGTGAIGIEAISRGCEEAQFVEMDPWVGIGRVLFSSLPFRGVIFSFLFALRHVLCVCVCVPSVVLQVAYETCEVQTFHSNWQAQPTFLLTRRSPARCFRRTSRRSAWRSKRTCTPRRLRTSYRSTKTRRGRRGARSTLSPSVRPTTR
jgi:hypothetical protein